MEQLFLIIHVLIAVGLIGVVLIQRSDTDGFGLGSGSGANLMSGRQAANLLTRSTAILATLFILNSLWLGILAANKTSTSLVDQIEAVGGELGDTAPIALPTQSDVEEVIEPVVEEIEDMIPAEGTAPAVPAAE